MLRVILISAVPAIILLVIMPNKPEESTRKLELSKEDYADGAKRSAAVAQKATPLLKEAFQKKGLAWQSPIFIRAFKTDNILEVWVKKEERFVLFKSYPILAASGAPGPKQQEGDRQVPEGFYFVNRARMNPQSRFHLSFNIGYPNEYDRALNRTGSAIMVHGSDVSIGCLAMGDDRVEEIYTLAEAAFEGGQSFFRVHLFPFHLTAANLRTHSRSEWLPFWENLQTGYQWFEDRQVPPRVTVKENRYHFE